MYASAHQAMAQAAVDAAGAVGELITVSVCGCDSYRVPAIVESTAVEIGQGEDSARVVSRDWSIKIPECHLYNRCRPEHGSIIIARQMKFVIVGAPESNGFELRAALHSADAESPILADIY